MIAKDQLNEIQLKLKTAEERIKEAKDGKDEKRIKEAEAERDALDKQAKAVEAELQKKEFKAPFEQWESKDAYLSDSYRLVANQKICLTCHSVGSIKLEAPKGPPLDLAWQRLRPEWTERWIAHPQRFMTYSSPMPVNFSPHKIENQDAFAGSSREQVTAARDFLMNFPRAIDMPVNRHRPILAPAPTPAGGK